MYPSCVEPGPLIYFHNCLKLDNVSSRFSTLHALVSYLLLILLTIGDILHFLLTSRWQNAEEKL